MDNAMFSGFANVALPKDANLIAEPAQVVVMVPGTRAKTAEGALANLKNVIICAFLVFILGLLLFLYYKVQGSKRNYEGQVLPGIAPLDSPTIALGPLKPTQEPPKDLTTSKPVYDIIEKPAPPEEDIVHIMGDIPTWAEDDASDEIDKKITDTDETIIAKLKGREEFVKALGEQVAAQTKLIDSKTLSTFTA
jgi:hypothetical protein